jgi:hypothetical protein
MKKVALIGTHGIRKTTHCHGLIHLLKQKGINADFLGEVARSSPFPINEETTESSQRWILYTQIAKELEFEIRNPDILVCDRSTLDNYAYFVKAFGISGDLNFLIKEHIKTYDAVIKVPLINGGIIEDGVRSTDPEFQRTIDSKVTHLLNKFQTDYVNFDTLENAAQYVLEKCGYAK